MAEESEPEVAKPRSRRWLAVIILTLAVDAAGLTFFILYRAMKNERIVKDFKASIRSDWEIIGDEANELEAGMSLTASPSDLPKLSKASDEMRHEVQGIIARRKQTSTPSGYAEVLDRGETALASLDSYLGMVSSLTRSTNAETIGQNPSLLENRARRARSDMGDFLSDATFLKGSIPGDLFQAGSVIQDALEPPGNAVNEQEREDVYKAVDTFMTADIKNFETEVIWSLVSSRKNMALEMMGVTKETVLGNWRAAWGNDKQEDFFVSKSQIDFPAADSEGVKVVVYLEKGSPKIEHVRLVKEATGWKIDSYPFVGWL